MDRKEGRTKNPGEIKKQETGEPRKRDRRRNRANKNRESGNRRFPGMKEKR